METFKIRDKEIDVEKIKKIIKERVEKKRTKGIYNRMIDEYFKNKVESYKSNRMYINLGNAKEMAEIDIDYKIESRRTITGNLIIFIKEIIRFIIGLPLRPLYEKQERFNLFVVEFLRSISERLERIELEKELKEP